MVHETIEEKLKAAFKPEHLDIINESYQHNVPINSESHFKIILVSNFFIKKTLLARHRSIYSVLTAEMANGLHALVLHTYTLDEWKKKQDIISVLPHSYCKEF